MFECKRDIEKKIEELCQTNSLQVGPIGEWLTSGKVVSVVGLRPSRSKSPYASMMGKAIRWTTIGEDKGFFSNGLAYVPNSWDVNLPKCK
jgi:hypothetical protein